MAGTLSENAPRPVSVVTVEGGIQTNLSTIETTNEQEQEQQQQQNTSNINNDLLLQNRLDNNINDIRCFASTEAQTDNSIRTNDYGIFQNTNNDEIRDARRRERRVRRHHRRAMRSCSMPPSYPGGPGCISGVNNIVGTTGMPIVSQVGSYLHPPPPHLGLRGLSLGLPFPVPASVSAFGRDAVLPKQCCGLGSPLCRWTIIGIGIMGLVFAATGAILGALRVTGRDHVAVSLLMIGSGIMLVTLSGLGWRFSSRENCGSFFSLTARIPPARPMHPYAAMIYPEFQFRTPPPSYQASMQEYRLRLLLLDRLQPTSSPPPTYRSNAASIVGPCTRESRPPSYCGLRTNVTPNATISTTKKDANLVRIVQTESEPVILNGDQTLPVQAAVEVLAHL